MRLPGLFTALMQMSIDAALDDNEEARARAEKLDGAVMAIEFTEFDAPLWLRPQGGRIDVLNQWNGGADVTVRGTVPGLLFANLNKERGKGGMRIEGDAATGHDFQQLLMSLDIDWEEKLSRFVGDTAAHRVGQALRGFRDWGRQSTQRAGDNLREYLQEEAEALPRRSEVNEFLGAVDDVRMAVDRLEARQQRLFRKLAQAGINVVGDRS
ncbi:MAG: SCP2 sterol-binding domain-containing protein [Gammaproteobacteria bacterium]|nr:SCP2 sterol-binding domain-containing protein [Gammaproteobacteria bacterium]